MTQPLDPDELESSWQIAARNPNRAADWAYKHVPRLLQERREGYELAKQLQMPQDEVSE